MRSTRRLVSQDEALQAGPGAGSPRTVPAACPRPLHTAEAWRPPQRRPPDEERETEASRGPGRAALGAAHPTPLAQPAPRFLSKAGLARAPHDGAAGLAVGPARTAGREGWDGSRPGGPRDGGGKGPGLGSLATLRASRAGPALLTSLSAGLERQRAFPHSVAAPQRLCEPGAAYSPGGSREDTDQGWPPGLDSHGMQSAVVRAGGRRPHVLTTDVHRRQSRARQGNARSRAGGPAAGVREGQAPQGACFQQGVSHNRVPS